jgi:hypothetical protein|nr:MAG TPA: DNA polymerase [Caudoviricetes sp.]
MRRNIVIFDFEVFKYDTLLGAIILRNDGEYELFQSWNLAEIRDFYEKQKQSIWIGHNIALYDNLILQEVVHGKSSPDIKRRSDELITHSRKGYLDIPLYYYDLMSQHMIGLKTVECAVGKDISTSEVDFGLNRPLTAEEKALTESYNRDDLDQTLDDFYDTISEFTLRLDVINEFKLPLDALHVTGTQLAEMVLHAEKIDNIADWYLPPVIYDTLKVKNRQVLDFYINEEFRKGKNLSLDICGTPHKLGAGGIHGALKKYHSKWAWYFDVSGYYNLVMINYDLLPRSIPDEYKQFYTYMYHEQLKLKKTNPNKRWVYKIILLSVFGAMTNEYCKFYDPNRGTLVTMVGQMFLVDLLEKLEGKIILVQSNTDGVIAEPLPGVDENEIRAIIDEWQERTGFVLKLEKVYDIHQRDVNCYMYRTEDGKIKTLGEAVKHYDAWENPFYEDVYRAKEPVIIEHAIVDYFMYGKLPEQTIEENKRKLRMFQFIAKKMTYDWMDLEKLDIASGNLEIERLGSVCRAFAYNNRNVKWTIFKHKHEGRASKCKLQNAPENVFVHNKEILSDAAIDECIQKIDFDYYINRSYERIQEFIKMKQVKKIL